MLYPVSERLSKSMETAFRDAANDICRRRLDRLIINPCFYQDLEVTTCFQLKIFPLSSD